MACACSCAMQDLAAPLRGCRWHYCRRLLCRSLSRRIYCCSGGTREPRRQAAPGQPEHMNRLVRLSVPFRVVSLREVGDAYERPVAQPAEPFEGPVLDLAFLRARKLERLALACNRPVAEAKRS